jgi:curved DNA-binding protein CbpA
MRIAEAGSNASGRVPRLASGRDPRDLVLSPAEGYLLSRVDGRTPWRVLREIGGLDPCDVDRCLERWHAEGWLEFDEARSRAAPQQARSAGVPADTGSSSPPRAPCAIDPALEIPVEAQERILAFEARLDRPYHEILGVPRDADARSVKRAYFELSKDFHPDRYFRREIGPFAERLERVFQRIAEAYELLSDPTARAEIERALDESPRATSSRPESARAAAAPRRRFHGLHPRELRVLAQRKARAKTFFETGMAAFQAGRSIEAAASVRLAIAFDPSNSAYRESFASVQRKASEERARQLVREAERALELRDMAGALRLYEDALLHQPHDPSANHEAARLALALGEDLRRAKEYAARACELVPENAAHRRTLGQIYKSAGLVANARRELEAALKLDPMDGVARSELRTLA